MLNYRHLLPVLLCAVMGCAPSPVPTPLSLTPLPIQKVAPLKTAGLIPAPSSHLVVRSPIPAIFKRPLTLRVEQDTPLKEVFLLIAEKAGVNIMIDHNIHGFISFYAAQQPLIDLLEQICQLGHLRYHIYPTGVRIEQDTP